MRVAIVAPRDPIPIYSGLLERLYQLSRFLGERHIVRVYFPYEKYRKQDETGRQPDHQPFDRIGLESPFIEFLDKRVPAYSTLRGVYNLHPWLYLQLRRQLVKFEPDYVIIEMPYLAPVTLAATRGLNNRTVLSEHNVEYRLAERLDIPLASSLRSFEIQVARRMGTVVTVSHEDRQTLSPKLPDINFVVAPNGVDIERYQPEVATDDSIQRLREQLGVTSPVFVYHGSLGNAQNREAVTELLDEVFPAIREEIPPASLLLIGANPPPTSDPNVVCTGVIDDLPKYIAAADATVVPLRSGSGTNLKILEYLASGIPVTTTPIGAEGLPLKDGQTALVREETDELSQAGIRLGRDQDLRERLAEQTRRLAVERFDWNETLAVYDQIVTRNRTE